MNSQVPQYLLNNGLPFNFNVGGTNTTHLGNIGNFSNFSNTATNIGTETAKFAGFNNLMSGVGAGITAAASVGSLVSGIIASNKADKQAREQLNFAKTQFNEENGRYKAREKERLEANKAVAESANLYNVNPMTRK